MSRFAHLLVIVDIVLMIVVVDVVVMMVDVSTATSTALAVVSISVLACALFLSFIFVLGVLVTIVGGRTESFAGVRMAYTASLLIAAYLIMRRAGGRERRCRRLDVYARYGNIGLDGMRMASFLVL